MIQDSITTHRVMTSGRVQDEEFVIVSVSLPIPVIVSVPLPIPSAAAVLVTAKVTRQSEICKRQIMASANLSCIHKQILQLSMPHYEQKILLTQQKYSCFVQVAIILALWSSQVNSSYLTQLTVEVEVHSLTTFYYNVINIDYQSQVGSLIPVRGIPVCFQAHTPFLFNSAIETR